MTETHGKPSSVKRPLPSRLILLLGVPRGGTSWASKVFDAHPQVALAHEPTSKHQDQRVFRTMALAARHHAVDPEDLAHVLGHWASVTPATFKPPFFAKSFLRTPASLRTLAWFLAKSWKGFERLHRFCSTPDGRREFVLVVKSSITNHAGDYTRAFGARTLYLLRHPAAVVASRLRGIALGVMKPIEAARLLEWHDEDIAQLGFEPGDVERLSQTGLVALQWRLMAGWALHGVRANPESRIFVYENLTRDHDAAWAAAFEHAGLDFVPEVKQFLARSSRAGFDLRRLLGQRFSYFSVQRGDHDPVSQWKQELTADQVRDVRDVVGSFPVEEYWPDETWPADAPASSSTTASEVP